PLALELPRAGDELVHAAVAVRNFVGALHQREQVVGVKHSILGHLAQSLGAEGTGVAVTAKENADVAEEAADPSDRLGPVEVEPEAVAVFHNDRRRQIRAEEGTDGDGAGAGPAGAV